MEKKYYPNIEYNKSKRRTGLILSVLLFVLMAGPTSVFVATKQFEFALFFGIFIIFPIFLVPMIIKNYPLKNEPQVIIKDKEVFIDKVNAKFKDITLIRVTIELPASKLDSENVATLEKFKTEKPENVHYGNLDIVWKDAKGKSRVLYSHIDQVIDALETLLSLGLKHYEITYNIKRKSVKCEYDIRKQFAIEKEKSLQSTSLKNRKKQLL